MDPRIINDTFEKEPHICSKCECQSGNHLVFYKCPLFSGFPICIDCCLINMMKDDVDVQVSAKLGRSITKEEINSTCKNCGLNNACQNQKLVENLERGTLGDLNGQQPQGPEKIR